METGLLRFLLKGGKVIQSLVVFPTVACIVDSKGGIKLVRWKVWSLTWLLGDLSQDILWRLLLFTDLFVSFLPLTQYKPNFETGRPK